MTAFLDARELSKEYPGTLALDRFSLQLERGEVRGLVGENGAGKSTLVKILSGAIRPTSGELMAGGEAGPFKTPRAAIEAGIATIHQHLTVVPQLSVGENIALGREPALPLLGGTRSRRRTRALALAALDRLGARLDPDRHVAELSYAERQLVDIAKAVSTECALLILDEPTAALSRDDSIHLLQLLNRLADEGHAILFVSHRLDEVLALSHRVTVMRDGRHVATKEAGGLAKDDLITLMVGGVSECVDASSPGDTAVFTVREATAQPYFEDIGFTINAGEILGIAGVLGSGRSELLEALAGARRLLHGETVLGGRAVKLRSTRTALRHRIAFIPSDRQEKGLALWLSARTNIVLPPGGGAARRGVRRLRYERRLARELMVRTHVRPPAPEIRVGSLSGGNQQKTLIARLLYADPLLVLIDEPTQGVDVAGRAQIHDLLRDLASKGIAVLVSSSDVDELHSLCHRILTLRTGRISGELAVAQSTPEEVLRLILPA